MFLKRMQASLYNLPSGLVWKANCGRIMLFLLSELFQFLISCPGAISYIHPRQKSQSPSQSPWAPHCMPITSKQHSDGSVGLAAHISALNLNTTTFS